LALSRRVPSGSVTICRRQCGGTVGRAALTRRPAAGPTRPCSTSGAAVSLRMTLVRSARPVAPAGVLGIELKGWKAKMGT
jgi:hypothetical protein